MSSTAQNTIEIGNIQAELAQSKRLSELTDTELREVIDALFPDGVQFNAVDPKVKTGDMVFFEGFENVNAGNYGIGEALKDGPFIKTGVGAAVQDVDIKVKLG